eukprot:CAMPEP_0117017128 /NCGR_PEP_ID=MMETSP0472-20121206/13423_1 /TAXON_ID=693140 ORGANISM="Tiarina fusus, Strain LIS" /NCGR_SAMPLE_ID=MMETSP0472 /ASSEMBLY_ACC=CAM_ASM_000603 /LENGTH=747 /DNA_ID=CAMNT_0004721417 /DNA_START=252 /DNA_END=2492 /DNA_ORIENTATION=+
MDYTGRTPLMDAVRNHSSTKMITLLLNSGARADHCTENRSVIDYASRGVEGNLPVLKLLLGSLAVEEKSAAVNALLSQSPLKTTLDFAQNPQIRKLLIENGAITGAEYLTKMRNEIELPRVADSLLANGFKPKYPCVLLPGTCSSVLECWKSLAKPEWEGSRIWIDPLKLGLKLGLARVPTEDIAFLEHMRFEDDGVTDPPGICVRAAEGIHGIDYLLDAHLMVIKQKSVVWGDFIRVLARLGYTSTNLIGFPYDWRLAPDALQKRDKIFTKLKQTVEYLFEVNEERIALIGHSQGCKFGQYFLHWIEAEIGREWIDKHIQSFIALGAPWAGASKVVRAMISGESMGLPTQFLFGNRFMVALVRSLSSSPWLLPQGDTMNEHFFEEDDENVKKHWEETLPTLCENHDAMMENFFTSSPHLFAPVEEGQDLRSLQAPYVENLHCIYGINSKEEAGFKGETGTEIGAYFRKRPEPIKVGNKTIYWKLNPINDPRPGERHFVKGGIIKERPLPDLPSGDGTVPYESLTYSKKWISPDGQNIKHYEFDGVPHRETLLVPGVLNLVGELLCGGTPEEIHATDDKIDSIFDKSLDYITDNLCDENGVPYIVSCIIDSIRSTNALSCKGIGTDIIDVQDNEIKKLGTLFLSVKETSTTELRNVHPQTKIFLLKTFLASLEVPLIAIEGNENFISVCELYSQKRECEEVNAALKTLVDESRFKNLSLLLLKFLTDLLANPVNEVTKLHITEQYSW